MNAQAGTPPVSIPILLVTLVLLCFVPHVAQAQDSGSIRGQVTEADTGEPLPGASVAIEGTSRGAAADNDGRYRIELVPAGSHTLQISFLGYETETVPVTVARGEDVVHNVSLTPAMLSPGEVMVMGVRAKGQAQALTRQMNASYISNIVASDQMGRFPDASAPEAVQRLPGVSIQRDMGEGRYIQIRGGSPDMTQVTFNGEQVPAPEGDNRQIALDAVPVDILESIEVSKAITPAMDAEAIGGAVHLQTRRAPDRRILSIEGAGGYGSIRNEPAYSGSLVYGDRAGDGKFGYLFSGSFSRRDFGADSFEPVYDIGDLGPSDDVLEELEVRYYSLWRSRAGATASLDYRFNANSTLYLTGIYSELVDYEQRRNSFHNLGDGEYLSNNSVTGGALEFHHKSRREDQQSINVTAGGEHIVGSGIQFDYHGTYTRSYQDTPFDAEVVFVHEDVDFAPDISDPENVLSNPSADIRTVPYAFDEIEPATSIAENTDYVGAVNLTIPFSFGEQSAGTFQFGGKYRQKNAIQDVEENAWELADGADDIILGQDVGSQEFNNDGYNGGPHPFPSRITQKDDINSFVDNFGAMLDGGKNIEADAEDYELQEDVIAFYGMAEIDVTPDLMILPGVRYEMTRLDVQGNEFDPDAETITPHQAENDYGEFFPMVHARYRVAPRTNLRAAVTRTLARPNFFELAPYRIRDDEDLEIGNPQLSPTTSMNYDLMFEHYDRLIGVISAGVYYKQVLDPIFTFVVENDLGGETAQKRNGESAMIMGIETAVHQQLHFLPEPFDGIGIYGNYTYTDSESTLPGGLEAPLPGQADHVFNAAISYEKRGFSGQFSANYHSDHVVEFGGDSDAAAARESDEFVGEHLQFDISASYMVSPFVQVFGEIVNLTNERFVLYQGIRERPRQYEWYERWGRLGVRYSM